MDLAKSKVAFVQTVESIQDMEGAKKNAALELGGMESAGMAVRKHRVYEDYMRGLGSNIENKKARAVKLEEDIQKKLEVVKAHRIKKETLEAMCRDARKRHMSAAFKAEQKQADKLVNLRKRFEKQW